MTPQNAFKASDDFLGIKPSVEPTDTVAARRESEELPVFGADATESEREAQLEAFRRRRANLARAAAQMVFTKDIDTMGEDARAGLFRAATKAIYGFEDMDGRVSFGKKAGDMKSNLERLRKFLKGDYSQIESEDVTKWRSLQGADEIERFNHANEHLKAKGDRDWENGPGWVRLAGTGMPGAQFGNVMQNAASPTRDETYRKMSYETMNEEEKAAFRADTIKRYERQIAAANPLDMFLKTAAGLSDPAAWTLAKCYRNGTVDVKDIENITDTKEREKVLTALSMMRGDKAKGRILGISTDFTDSTAANRAQLGIYGLQQAFLGLATDVWDMGKAGVKELQIYAKSLYDAEEAKEMRKRTDLEARIAAALSQPLPGAEGFGGKMYQGVMENIPILLAFGVGGKGKAALKGIKSVDAALGMGEIAEAAKGAKAAATGLAFAKSEAGFVRQLAAFELYTERLKTLTDTADAAMKSLPKAAEALAKTGAAAKARGMVLAGRTAAFSTFANDYIETADAEGISRAESVPSAVLVGIINGAVEKLNLPGLESTITPAELKSLALRSAVEAFKHERSAGLRKWIADGVAIRAREVGRTVATEAFIEEPLQQFVTQMALEVDNTIGELREEGKLDAANAVMKLWSELRADGFGKAFRLYWDTAMESLPAAVGFGGVSVGMQRVRGAMRNADMRKETGDMNYDEGIVDVMERNRQARRMIAAHWAVEEAKGKGEGVGEGRATINRVNEAYSAARAAYGRRKVGDDTVRLVAEAAGVDRKTAEVLHDCLEVEESMALYSPRFRTEVNLADAVVDIDEKKLKGVLPEYVEGSFVADKAKGLYAAKINMPDGAEKTLVYRIGDMSEWIDEQIGENGLADEGELADSYEARRREMPEGAMKPWKELTQTERRDIALLKTDGFLSGRAGVFELTGEDGKTITVRADDIISLASGRIADVGYVGEQAKGRTLRHETFHALWRFAKGTLSKEDIAALYSHFPDLDPNNPSDRQLDERMAVEFERYASGNFVPMKPKRVLDRFSGWAFDKLGKLLDVVGVRREGVTDPVSGKPYTLSDFYDKVLRGELGSGELGVEKRVVESKSRVEVEGASSMNAPPGEVSEEELAAARARNEEILSGGEGEGQGAGEGVSPASAPSPSPAATPTPTTTPTAYTAENPADASVANAQFYRIGLPNSSVKLVGRLEVRDVETGVITSTDENYHDRGNLNRDDKSEESRGLVMKIAGRPDPLQVGTVQPIANNGIVWALPNGDIIIGNHRVNGVRAGYEKGTAGDLEKFVREDAAKRGIEIGENVKKPLMVFVLERIESPEGQKAADVHEVVRLANESQNRGFNIREQAGNDAKILTDNHLLSRMAFRADGRIDETKSAEAIGKFRQESGAQGLVGEDGMLTEEGQTRIQNAALAALLGGTGNAALLQRIMERSGTLDMASQVRALMKMTPDLMALAETKSAFDLRGAIGEALELFTEWREADEEKRVEKGKSRHDWREIGKDGKRVRGLSWEAFMAQGDMFRKPSDEAQILGDLFARTEELRSFDREDVESAAGKKRVIDLISGYLADYIANARAVNTETDDMFGAPPASRADVLQAQRARGENGARFSVSVGDTLQEKGRFDVLKNGLTPQQIPDNVVVLEREASPKDVADVFSEKILGQTFHLPVGGDFTFNTGHFFRLTCSGKTGRKGCASCNGICSKSVF